MPSEEHTDVISQLKERLGRWRHRRSSATSPPPTEEPHPIALARWIKNPSEFAIARRCCEDCYKRDHCEYHQLAKDCLHEYDLEYGD